MFENRNKLKLGSDSFVCFRKGIFSHPASIRIRNAIINAQRMIALKQITSKKTPTCLEDEFIFGWYKFDFNLEFVAYSYLLKDDQHKFPIKNTPNFCLALFQLFVYYFEPDEKMIIRLSTNL